jgi:hypothetical protein
VNSTSPRVKRQTAWDVCLHPIEFAVGLLDAPRQVIVL